ncbi:unnamed protein product [Peniophora sp. CBMAI 1063]|nr:unnamed protein product [Peniophora sp. CBMAI 1063]
MVNVSASTRTRHEDEEARVRSEGGRDEQATGNILPSFGADVEGAFKEELARSTPLLSQLCCTLVIWLHLRAGISRATSNVILRSLKLILATTFTIIRVAAQAAMGVTIPLTSPDIPVDVRTALKQRLIEPVILRTICCPRCFLVYGSAAPEQCTWRESPRSRVCATSLWTTRNTSQGPKRVPRCLYTTQCFDDWLRFFLGRQMIEDALIRSFQLYRDHRSDVDGDVHDVHESRAWHKLHGEFSNPYNLVFGIYIDWFNPLTNRIAGKKVSYGAIVLYCMNLPPELRFRPENVYIAGITPGPNAPNMITISHILELLINVVSRYTSPGHHVPTFHHPQGMLIQLVLAPLIADIEAVRKTAGFMSHSANLFCSFCDLPSQRIEELNSSAWTERSAQTVRAQAEQWRSLVTKKAKSEQATSTGVRWTPFYLMPSWNPIEHVMLGYMHNWIEGILKHQQRRLWNIGPDKENVADTVESHASEASELESDASSDTHSLNAVSDVEMPPSSSTPSGGSTPRASRFTLLPDDLEDDSDSDSDDELDITVNFGPAPTSSHPPFHFTAVQLSLIRSVIALVTLPTYLDRPPTNLGEAKHGKLKADTYLTLFAFIFPLIIPELWWAFPALSYERQLLDSFYHLMVATFVIISYVTSVHDRTLFSYHYISYRRSIQELFPVGSLPNHHYAMHYPGIMENWGPVASLSEFAGERLNGQLQRTKTNRRMRDMDFTMLRQTARRARLQALLHDTTPDDSTSGLTAILTEADPDAEHTRTANAASQVPGNTLTSYQLAQFLVAAPLLDEAHYVLILRHVQTYIRPFQPFDQLPAQPDIPILAPNAKRPRTLVINRRTYSDMVQHRGNSAVQYRDPTSNVRHSGFIQAIRVIPLEHQLRTFVLVSPHAPLPEHEFLRTPYAHYKLLRTTIFDAAPSPTLIVLEPKDIIAHVTTLLRPMGTYGVPRQTLVVCSSLDRGLV